MTRRVMVLPDELVNLIAAGEVVERPAAVVKELVENSLDAGAARVTVRLGDGGRRLVEVADDGWGMSRDDALMALERHATSKVAAVSDLAALGTYGFRGEALPSIAATGSFNLVTWDGVGEAGTRITVERGRIIAVEDVGRPRGTTVRLAGIFSRIPARRKFLRSRETELAFCLRAVEEAALARPSVHFEVTGDEGVLLALPPVKGLAERVLCMWGDETGRRLLPLAARLPGMSLAGFISPPALTWSRRDRHHALVNGRPVRDPLLNRLLASALAHRYPPGRHPALVLSLVLPPEEVDVNVHPSKREVRFARTAAVQELLELAVRELGRSAPLPRDMGAAAGAGGETEGGTGRGGGWSPAPAVGWGRGDEAEEGTAVAAQEPLAGLAAPPGPRVLGQVLSTYILAEREGHLVVVDQHAAHERIWFNRLLAARTSGSPPSQRLLIPALVELSSSERHNLFAREDVLRSFGFEFAGFGGGAVRITAVPPDLRQEGAASLVREIASDLAGVSSLPEDLALAVARRACHASVRAGRSLSLPEMAALLGELAQAEAGFACPHGRPTCVLLARSELERLFSRR